MNEIFNALSKHIAEAQNAAILSYLYTFLPDFGRQFRGGIKHRIEAVMNHSRYLVSIACTTGRFICVNDAWTKELGWTFDELTSTSFYAFIHEEDIRKSFDAFVTLQEGTNPDVYKTFTNRYKHKNGEYIPVEWFVFSEFDPTNNLIISIAQVKKEQYAVFM